MIGKKLISNVAWSLHYNSWYKESIEGKFADENGVDHGRFRKSKNVELDKEFVSGLKFDENGFSELKTPEGYPYYKMEDGTFYVDSALKGWDFLPPSWKKENEDAAEYVLGELETVIYTGENIREHISMISKRIHNQWVARQVANELGITSKEVLKLGRLSKNEVDGFAEGESKLWNLFKNAGKNVTDIWGYQNFGDFETLPYEEKIKDSNQIKYALECIINTDNLLKNGAELKQYPLERQYRDVVEKLSPSKE